MESNEGKGERGGCRTQIDFTWKQDNGKNPQVDKLFPPTGGSMEVDMAAMHSSGCFCQFSTMTAVVNQFSLPCQSYNNIIAFHNCFYVHENDIFCYEALTCLILFLFSFLKAKKEREK